MSDLQCPATLILARHAEAEFDPVAWPDAGGSLTSVGREQARALGESLSDRRVATVWSSDVSRTVQTAEIAAAVLGVAVRVRPGLREFGVGRPDESADDVVSRVRWELESLADEVRGETALVVSHGAAIGLVVRRLVGPLPDAAATPLDPCACCELATDSGGWALRAWAGSALSSLGSTTP